MKYIPVLWFKVFIIGLFLSSSADAEPLDEEAKKTFLDYLTNNKYITPVSPIFKAVREKRCKVWYTLAKRSPTAPAIPAHDL